MDPLNPEGQDPQADDSNLDPAAADLQLEGGDGGGSNEGGDGGEPEGGAPAAQPVAAPAAGMDPAAIKALVAEVFQQSRPPAPKEDPFDVSKLSPEQFNQKFNVYTPSADLLRRLRSDDEAEALAAVNELVTGSVKQAVTMAQFHGQAAVNPLAEQVQTLQQHYAQVRESEAAQRFSKQYPDLVPWEPIVQAVKERLAREVQSGQRQPFASEEAVFKALAEQTRELVKKIPGGSGGTATQPRSTQRPSTVTTGGQGGTGAGSSTQAKNPAMQLWK